MVFGEGNANCEVLFIGEAPGQNEDEQRRPFVGRGGQLLRQMIREIGWKEQDVYITNIVKRRPPGNRDPLPEEIAAYKPYLTRQVELIAPKVIVPLGRFSTNYFLPEAKITRDQGRAFRVPAHPYLPAGRQGSGEGGDAHLVIPMLHPAAALRAPEMMRAFQETFRKLPDVIAKGVTVDIAPAFAEARADKPAKAKPATENRLF